MDYVIETCDLCKQFGTVQAVSALNLRVARNQVTGFLGRNGAGKSTTLKMLLGMTHPTSGSGLLLGRSITDPNQDLEARRQVAYCGEDKQLYAYMTVQQLIRFTASFYPDWRSDAASRLLDQFQLPPGRKIKALSKGMRTKLALLLALARRPSLLILDEPTEGLDPVAIEELLQTLSGLPADGTSVFFFFPSNLRGRTHCRPGVHYRPRPARRGSFARRDPARSSADYAQLFEPASGASLRHARSPEHRNERSPDGVGFQSWR